MAQNLNISSSFISPVKIRESFSNGYECVIGKPTNDGGSLFAHAEGYESIASGEGSHADGYRCTAAGNYSHSIGDSVKTYAEKSTVIGSNSNIGNNSSNSVIIGQGNNIKQVPNSIVIGRNVSDSLITDTKVFGTVDTVKNVVVISSGNTSSNKTRNTSNSDENNVIIINGQTIITNSISSKLTTNDLDIQTKKFTVDSPNVKIGNTITLNTIDDKFITIERDVTTIKNNSITLSGSTTIDGKLTLTEELSVDNFKVNDSLKIGNNVELKNTDGKLNISSKDTILINNKSFIDKNGMIAKEYFGYFSRHLIKNVTHDSYDLQDRTKNIIKLSDDSDVLKVTVPTIENIDLEIFVYNTSDVDKKLDITNKRVFTLLGVSDNLYIPAGSMSVFTISELVAKIGENSKVLLVNQLKLIKID